MEVKKSNHPVHPLFLNHLPAQYAFCDALEFARKTAHPPTLLEIEQAFLQCGAEKDKLEEILSRTNSQCATTLCKLEAFNQGENKSQNILSPAHSDELITQQMNKHPINYPISYVDIWSKKYPISLKNIPNPPWALYYRGKLPQFISTIGIVGTRRPNSYGGEVISYFLGGLKTRPVQIISGLAYGIDTLAHFHSCENNIPNFAVLAGGLDTIYPRSNTSLAQKILEKSGGLLSEYPPGTDARPYYFPFRNRIISAFADVVWVVQGTSQSGTVHTINHALEQSKTLVACPGDLFNELMSIPHRLLYDGAQIILKPEDLDILLQKKPSLTNSLIQLFDI